MLENADKIQTFGKTLKDAALLTTITSGGATAEVTVPAAAAGVLIEGSMKVFKGAVSWIANDTGGKNESKENAAKQVLEFGEDLIMKSMPLSAPIKAANGLILDQINDKAITPINQNERTP